MNTFLGHLVDLSRIVIVSSYVVTSEVCLGSQPKLKYTLCIVSVSHLNYKVPEEHLWQFPLKIKVLEGSCFKPNRQKKGFLSIFSLVGQNWGS